MFVTLCEREVRGLNLVEDLFGRDTGAEAGRFAFSSNLRRSVEIMDIRSATEVEKNMS